MYLNLHWDKIGLFKKTRKIITDDIGEEQPNGKSV